MPKQIKLDIGSGRAKFEDYITVDNDPSVGADICVDILEKTPQDILALVNAKVVGGEVTTWGNPEVDEVRAFHLLEHLPVDKRVAVMKLFYELLAPGGILHIEVPIAGTPQFWQDPTHLSGWTNRTFWYFTKGNKFGESFAKRHSDCRLFEFVEDETRNDWAYRIKLRKPNE